MVLYDTERSLEAAAWSAVGAQFAAPVFAASCRSLIFQVEGSSGKFSSTASKVIKAILDVSLAFNSLDASSGEGIRHELVSALLDSVLLPVQDCMTESRHFFSTDPAQCSPQLVKDNHRKMRDFGIIAYTQRMWLRDIANDKLKNAERLGSESEALSM